jgi:uncharacterized protein with HEPN domain
VTQDPADSPGLEARTRHALEDFLEFAETAARLVARGRKAYDSDDMLRLAAEAILHRIGEAIARLPDDFLDTHPGVSWRPMMGVRDLIGHEYGAIDHRIVWNALTTDCPEKRDTSVAS